jgi:hypothetical protein
MAPRHTEVHGSLTTTNIQILQILTPKEGDDTVVQKKVTMRFGSVGDLGPQVAAGPRNRLEQIVSQLKTLKMTIPEYMISMTGQRSEGGRLDNHARLIGFQ